MISKPVTVGLGIVIIGLIVGVVAGALGGAWFDWGSAIGTVLCIAGLGFVFTWVARNWRS